MTTAHCPNCNSTLYTPDPSNGGAGRNKCLECGQASMVARWYTQPAPGKLNDMLKQIVDRNPDDFAEPYEPPTRSQRLHTDKPAAPIRQYKDDDE